MREFQEEMATRRERLNLAAGSGDARMPALRLRRAAANGDADWVSSCARTGEIPPGRTRRTTARRVTQSVGGSNAEATDPRPVPRRGCRGVRRGELLLLVA